MHLQKRIKKEDIINIDVSKNTLGLPAFIDILSLLQPKSKLLKEVRPVNDINGLRNSVAHNLDMLNLDSNKNYKKIELAVKAIQNMLITTFSEIEEEDFEYLTEKNKELKGLL
ncbi:MULTISPECIES: CRISPR type III-a/mtube-associated protein csm6 [Staphylococcus]|uniref:CRISPR-associated protein Csm6 n=1 Tax=Staphylococcus lugdunensis TaxID=28035 RepID=A0ABX6BUG0_STALU|nr:MULTISPECIES: CRISPR type III-a/mtube-associated protein csm6 [Staphylococcus]ARJ07969.1 CRISPR-associated protein Csm6 [Staphylococcus lugdunensis]ARJ15060.1 CRISPR-associated protein Csm6 [Staphylococcus lugdunensis]ARJ28445.1 CRISPR-associated protein Csm6 [Staphylococcus lugdunensis]EKS22892.1 CRISPR type III-a/mtube-associated protein csm6 [Staphylococcus lugdunensis ACS-027-V-Sch2]MDU3182129.1 hypothetical protein [Staphylococcus lugdunensis]